MNLSLSHHYASLSQAFPVVEDSTYASLVIPAGNDQQPVHRWFHLKEAFSHRLLQQLMVDADLDTSSDLTLLDPFAGVGTSIVSAMQIRSAASRPAFARAYGIECNPFLQFVAATKATAGSLASFGLDAYANEIVNVATCGQVDPSPLPGLSTFANTRYFPPTTLRDLLLLKSAISAIPAPADARNAARLCLAATIEPACALRRDGRALRYESSKARVEPTAEFLRLMSMVRDDSSMIEGTVRASVLLGDGRHASACLPPQVIADLICFSPPYPNNIDYTEVYKLEAWLLDFIATPDAFRQQRLRTVRSHPSIYFPEIYGPSSNGYRSDVAALLQPVLDSVPSNGDRHFRYRMIRGYFDDMLQTLVSLRQLLTDRGILVYVVGNSLHGSNGDYFVIAADLMLARLAQLSGYRVSKVVVARRTARKIAANNPLLRESVVFLRKDASSGA